MILERRVHELGKKQPGAIVVEGGLARFRVWAPRVKRLEVVRMSREAYAAAAVGDGWFEAKAPFAVGDRYWYRLDCGGLFPDPASRYQPEGVHGPSEVVEEEFGWGDLEWRGLPLDQSVFYELHVGSFTRAGTFDAVIERLGDLVELGVTAIELMPVAAFPGKWNWGYDGVYPWAVQCSYGGPRGLKRLVDACHRMGLAVVLDVVLNHLGPEGCYLRPFGPYFQRQRRTPWGESIHYDGRHPGPVREHFVGAAIRWLEEFHVDALRLDATCYVLDDSPVHVLAELAGRVRELRDATGREIHLIAEHGPLDCVVTAACKLGGWGLDAAWNDDFHHALRAYLTGEHAGRPLPHGRGSVAGRSMRPLRGFGSFDSLAETLEKGFLRMRRRGDLPTPAYRQLVAYTHNHDQVANWGDSLRLGRLVSEGQREALAVATILGPFLPLLFMGEEYGDPAPFFFFTDFGDSSLAEAVRVGRMKEYEALGSQNPPPDPQSEEALEHSRIDWDLRWSEPYASLLGLYRQLIELRKQTPVVAGVEANRERHQIVLHRRGRGQELVAVLDLREAPGQLESPGTGWRRVLPEGTPICYAVWVRLRGNDSGSSERKRQ